MSGHAGDTVIQNNGYAVTSVVYHVEERSHAAMEEGRVTQNANRTFFVAGDSIENLLDSVCSGYGCAHTAVAVHSVVRSGKSESVAADIAAYYSVFTLAEFVEESSVRATCAQSGRTCNYLIVIEVYGLEALSGYRFTDNVGSKFAECGKESAAVGSVFSVAYGRKTEHLNCVFNIFVVFFDYINLIESAYELFDEVHRKRIGKSEF